MPVLYPHSMEAFVFPARFEPKKYFNIQFLFYLTFLKFYRYPTKDWKSVGEFTLKEERSIQNFTLKEAEDYFAKFVRVELTEHYGNEHFCPLTIFR